MRRYLAPLIAATAALAVTATTALAVQPTPTPLTFKVSATSTKGKGSKKKPVPVGVSYTVKATTADGSRQETFATLDNAWYGVRSNGKYFPKCTATQIATAQSDTGCPKGSLVGTGTLTAVVGPETDFSAAGVPCKKTVHLYNAGQNKFVTLLVGPGADCAGVGYLPPFPGTWGSFNALGGGQSFNTAIPPNISHPLPGVLGSTTDVTIKVPKRTVTVKGKKIGYLESIACTGSKRKYVNYIVGDPSGKKYRNPASASSC